jgi:hypothetical protein
LLIGLGFQKEIYWIGHHAPACTVLTGPFPCTISAWLNSPWMSDM